MLFYWDEYNRNTWREGSKLMDQGQQNNPCMRHLLWERYLRGSSHIVTTDYQTPGFWYTSLEGVLGVLIGCWEQDRDKFVDALPDHVKQGMKDGKLTLLVDNSAEGRDLNFDEIYTLHMGMIGEGLPEGSVVFITGSVDSTKVYHNRVRQMHGAGFDEIGPPMVDFAFLRCYEFMEVTDPEEDIDVLPIETAMAMGEEAKDFLSLNQTIKAHRMEHVYWMIMNDYHKRGIMNASWVREGSRHCSYWRNDPEGDLKFVRDTKNYHMLLKTDPVLPLHADFDCTQEHPDVLPDQRAYYHRDLFEKTLLHFVTESEFDNQESIFLTEKVYKTLLAGHPMILLAPAGSVKFLESQGFRLDVCDIDHSYDYKTDHLERFEFAHNSLQGWIERPLAEKHHLIKRDMWKLRHNRYLCHKYMCMNYEHELFHAEEHSGIMQSSMWKNFKDLELFLKCKWEDMVSRDV